MASNTDSLRDNRALALIRSAITRKSASYRSPYALRPGIAYTVSLSSTEFA